jgi:hypothetical protein
VVDAGLAQMTGQISNAGGQLVVLTVAAGEASSGQGGGA